MCGISGIIYNQKNNGLEIFESLLSIQHRGQDGGGICCFDTNETYTGQGLIHNLFNGEQLKKMNSKMYLGHTRYKTNNIKNSFQPFTMSNQDIHMGFCHNGNIINSDEIQEVVKVKYGIEKEENISDSMALFKFIFHFLNNCLKTHNRREISNNDIVDLSVKLHDIINGSFSIIFCLNEFGIIAMKDKRGIRPLVYGNNEDNDFLISSESCSLNNVLDYNNMTELNPGETIIFPVNKNNKITKYQHQNIDFSPCLFEYIYFSRLDSIVNKISVYNFRYKLGELLGNVILKEKLDIDFIIPIPETSRLYAYGISKSMNIPIQECIIKDRYTNRTFIIENKKYICQNIKRKLSVIKDVVKNKTVLLIDDSVVRGNTSSTIIRLLKEAGVKTVIFGSASPKINNTNQFGIYIEKKKELITYNNSTNDLIAKSIGARNIYYNDLDDVIELINDMNPLIRNMEISMFLQ